jgi:hypothetical protein
MLAKTELYGSELVAGLDRQHPHDFFKVRGLFIDSVLTPDIVEGFEVLFSCDLDMRPAYENEFQGMTRETLPLFELVATRELLRSELGSALKEGQKRFLINVACLGWSGI